MDVKFVKSSNDYRECPNTKLPEFAFIGRSNVGKSSLINMLAGVKKLAKISSMPGKTQLINHFIVDNDWHIVDLPGYGYARTSKQSREHFEELIKGYIVTRVNLMCLFVLVDSRLEPQKLDLDFIEFLGESQVPYAIVFTKTDKISLNQVDSNMSKFKKELLKTWEELPQIFITSTVERKGKKEIMEFIENIIVSSQRKK